MLGRAIRWITATESTAAFAQQIIALFGWIGVFSIGAFASMKAAMTEWFAEWGWIGWISFGVSIAGASAIIFWITAVAISRLAHARLTRAYTFKEKRINPLQHHFQNEIIDLSDFDSPGPMVYPDRTFLECQIRGPGTIFIGGRSVVKNNRGHIYVVETEDETIDSGSIIIFSDVKFIGCSFYRVTILGPKGFRQRLFGSDTPNPTADLSPQSP